MAKRSGLDALLERSVGRRHDAHVGPPRLAVTDTLEGPLFEEAQEFGLGRGREFTDFVESVRIDDLSAPTWRPGASTLDSVEVH